MVEGCGLISFVTLIVTYNHITKMKTNIPTYAQTHDIYIVNTWSKMILTDWHAVCRSVKIISH